MSCDNDNCTVSTDVTHSISGDGSFMITTHLSLNPKERYSICANITYETGESFITNEVDISKYLTLFKLDPAYILLGTHDIQKITITNTTNNELCIQFDLVIG